MKDLAARGSTSRYPLDGGRRRVTIYDIAQTCGVSAMTVSRVINGRSDVARSTRVAVEAAIDRLGYRPNAVARSLVEGRSRLIGVVAAGVWEAGIGKTLAVISAEAQSSGYGLLLRTVPTGRPRDLARAIDYLTQHAVAEIIVLGPDPAARSSIGIGQVPPGTPPQPPSSGTDASE